MRARDLRKILNDLWGDEPLDWVRYRVITKDGRAVTGVQVDRDKKTVILVQRDTFIETRVDT